MASNNIQTIIDDIKSKVDIVDFVGSYVNLKRSGKYFKANCPFHQEKTPSFVVSPEIQRWQCFGACHEGGDIISFLMKWENIPFSEALKLLAEKAGVTLSESFQKSGFADSESEKRNKIFEMNELAAKYYSYLLKNHPSAEGARKYLASRNLPEGMADKFRLGYSPNAWDSLVEFLKKKGYKDEDLVMAGLAVKTSRGGAIDRFRGRLMFPLENTLGRVVGFSGRLLGVEPSEKTGAKYVNSPETLVYHKRETLYGFSISKDDVRKQNSVIVVEGEFDFLTPFSKGIENIVAIKGSAFTTEQLRMLRRYCDKLILALDNDKAGQDALRRSIVEAVPFGFEIYVCEMPGGKDPDDAAREHLVEFKKIIANPSQVFDYLFESLSKNVDSKDAYSKKKFTENFAEFLVLLENPIVREHYIQKVADFVSSSKESVEEILRNTKRKKSIVQKSVESEEKRSLETPRTIVQKELLTSLFNLSDKEMVEKVLTTLTGHEFDEGPYRQLYLAWTDEARRGLPVDIAKCLVKIPQESRAKAEELYLASSINGADKKHEAKEVYRLALTLKKHYALLMLKNSGDNDGAEDSALAAASEMIKSVEKELQTL
ncbi:MAG: DNA primase [Patescibacteria group bacterium]